MVPDLRKASLRILYLLPEGSRVIDVKSGGTTVGSGAGGRMAGKGHFQGVTITLDDGDGVVLSCI